MLESGSGLRRWGIALAAGALVVGLLPAVASASGPAVVGFSVSADMWSSCVSGGPVPSGASVTVSQKRDRTILATRTVKAKNGRFTACVTQIQPADALTITTSGMRRALNVPFLAGAINLATDTVSGAVPPGSTNVDLDLVKTVDGLAIHTYTKSVVPDDDGSFDADFSG
ncbi:MAG: hypothetical protein U0869_24565, partial [Chloroflexota bacterium]